MVRFRGKRPTFRSLGFLLNRTLVPAEKRVRRTYKHDNEMKGRGGMTRAATFRTAAVLGAFLIAALMIMSASRAAFTDSTDNQNNTFATGDVVLTDSQTENASGAAMFNVSNMQPGDSANFCIDVIYKGSLNADVVTSAVSASDDSTAGDDLTKWLDIVADRYAGSGCSGTAEASGVITGTLDSPTIGESAWSAVGGGTDDIKSYDITVTLNSGAGNEAQGVTSSDGFFEWTATDTATP